MGRDMWSRNDTAMARCDHKVCKEFARQKVENVKKWKAVHQVAKGQELELVLVGDNGEGDAEAAQELLQGGLIQWAFIREVKGHDRGIFHEKRPSSPSSVQAEGLHYFEDYAHAADIAVRLGLLSEAAQRRVRAEAELAPVGRGSEGVAGLILSTRDHYNQSRARGVSAFWAGYGF